MVVPMVKPPLVRIRAYDLFFNAPEVERLVDKGTLMALRTVGAFVRADARQSMRRRRRAAEPGQPPSVHTGTLKYRVEFVYDTTTRSLVIGPEILGRTAFYSPTVPEILEYGGERRINDRQAKALVARINRLAASGRDSSGRFIRWTQRKRRIQDVPRVLKYEARPYMGPAYAKALPRIEQKFAGLVDKALGGGGLLGGG